MAAEKSFKEMAGTYDLYRGANDQVLNALNSIVSAMNRGGKKLRILDVGCGTGGYSIPLTLKHDLELTGIDVSEEMLSQARSKYPQGEWIHGDFEYADLETCSYDIVLMSYVVHHFVDLRGALSKASKLLSRRGGRLVIVTDDHDQFLSSPVHRYIPRAMEIDLRRFPSVDELRLILEDLKLDVNVLRVGNEVRISSESDVEDLLRGVRVKYISTLTLLTETEFSMGLEKLSSSLRVELSEGPIVRVRERTIIIASKGSRDIVDSD